MNPLYAALIAIWSVARPAALPVVLLAGALLTACSAAEGTIAVSLVTAPGSDVPDRIARVRLTLSEPPTVLEAERDPERGFVLSLDVDARGQTGALTFEGFDQGGALIAYGQSGPLPIAAIDATVALYIAAPLSLAEAPVTMNPARADMGVAAVAYGVIFAGGRYTGGGAADDLTIYNVYSHDFQRGQDMPEARARPTVMAGAFGAIYLFGGTTGQGSPSAQAWRFAADVPPAGAYIPMTSDPALARAGAPAAPRSQDTFVVTGDPLAQLNGTTDRVTPYPGAAEGLAVHGTATSVTTGGRTYTLLVGQGAGTSGALLAGDGDFAEVSAPAELRRTRHATVVLPDRTFVTVAGELEPQEPGGPPVLPASGVRVDPERRDVSLRPALLATPRCDAAVAATGRYLVVAGGQDAGGAVLGDAEIFDAATLEPVATLPLLVARTRAHAAVLANGQVLIAGGSDAAGQPISVLELFTPAP